MTVGTYEAIEVINIMSSSHDEFLGSDVQVASATSTAPKHSENEIAHVIPIKIVCFLLVI